MKTIDKTRLAQIPAALQPFIDRRELAGIVLQTWHRGELVQAENLGFRNLETQTPMTSDTLFRIASMSRVPTSVAVMMLVEEGKLALQDPVKRWLPELANRQVLRNAEGPVDDTVPANRDITIDDLLTHRSGLAYGIFSQGPIAGAYFAALGDPRVMGLPSDKWIAALGTLPLSYQPGERMNYGHSTDVLGVLLERIEGKRLGVILNERIFAPLGMKDTGFFVPEGAQGRIATTYGFDKAAGKLVPSAMPVSATPPVFDAGGTGLVSSAPDYARLARMLLNEGTLDKVRVLRPETVRTMASNHLTAQQRTYPFIGRPIWDGMGFGLGLGVVDIPEKSLLGYGSRGAFGWPGAWGTWWQSDPANDLAMVYMIQHEMPLSPDAGDVIAGGQGMAGRMALPVYQKLTYGALSG
ncbi:serine hydrolase domain-containing protein [Sphingobium subterraneum]|uniref:CubicO group peptidase (Beta-lactamase class C family) n=1 Tax=Sphingobium subterraneum TaxID=627688 RepID=A0A841J3A5_9SPHN|nr:serine hydrolase domain-containing protein [Sphingobium subterraneum]MBB6125297.1 CubicO group peptidase (beta-lactamase class C family) [Sphingobium subterraneum]